MAIHINWIDGVLSIWQWHGRLEESIGLKKVNSPSQGVQFAEQDLQQPLHGSGHIGASQANVVPCKLYSAPPINSATMCKISVIK